jgi:hypothetical protein
MLATSRREQIQSITVLDRERISTQRVSNRERISKQWEILQAGPPTAEPDG